MLRDEYAITDEDVASVLADMLAAAELWVRARGGHRTGLIAEEGVNRASGQLEARIRAYRDIVRLKAQQDQAAKP